MTPCFPEAPPGLVLLSWPLGFQWHLSISKWSCLSPSSICSWRCAIPSHVSVESPNRTVNSVPLLLHAFFPCPNQFFNSGITKSYKHAVIFIIFLLTLLPNSPFLLFFCHKIPWKSSLTSIFNSLLIFPFLVNPFLEMWHRLGKWTVIQLFFTETVLLRSLMISRLLCPTGKSHSLPLWHLIHDHCLFANAFASLGCSRIPFTFYLSSCFIGLFLWVWCASSTSYFCTRPQGLVSKPRRSPEHQLWFMALKSHF